MNAPADLRAARDRLAGSEPIRILIGERFYAASEIVPVPAYATRLRRELLADIEAQLAALETRPDPPAAHAGALPSGGTA